MENKDWFQSAKWILKETYPYQEYSKIGTYYNRADN